MRGEQKIVIVVLGILVAVTLYWYAVPRKTEGRNWVTFSSLPSNTKVFVDNERVKLSHQNALPAVAVAEGVRDILVSKEGYWPWLKQVTVTSGNSVHLQPFFFPRDVSPKVIQPSSPEFNQGASLLAQTVPTEPDILVSHDGTVTVWREGSELRARWKGSVTPPLYFCAGFTKDTCSTDVTFLSIAEAVRSVSFWGSRSDVVIIAMAEDVYALELDRHNVQNFQPIYHGKHPIATSDNRGFIFIKDDSETFLIAPE